MSIKLRDVSYFETVVEHGNIGRAAEALGLSQPALSKSLQRIERAVKSKLLKRTPKGVELTPSGAALLSQARRLSLAVNDVLHEIDDLGEGRSGFINIGSGPDTGQEILPEALGLLLRAAPKTQCSIAVYTYDKLLDALRCGELDLIISGIPGTPPENMTQIYLYDHDFGIYASAGHPLAKRKKLTLADLSNEQWALAAAELLPRRSLNQIFEDHGIPAPRVAVELAPTSIRLQIVSSTGLLGFFWNGIVKQVPVGVRLKQLRIAGVTWKRRVGITHRKDAYLSPVTRRLLEILKTIAARKNTVICPGSGAS